MVSGRVHVHCHTLDACMFVSTFLYVHNSAYALIPVFPANESYTAVQGSLARLAPYDFCSSASALKNACVLCTCTWYLFNGHLFHLVKFSRCEVVVGLEPVAMH